MQKREEEFQLLPFFPSAVIEKALEGNVEQLSVHCLRFKAHRMCACEVYKCTITLIKIFLKSAQFANLWLILWAARDKHRFVAKFKAQHQQVPFNGKSFLLGDNKSEAVPSYCRSGK